MQYYLLRQLQQYCNVSSDQHKPSCLMCIVVRFGASCKRGPRYKGVQHCRCDVGWSRQTAAPTSRGWATCACLERCTTSDWWIPGVVEPDLTCQISWCCADYAMHAEGWTFMTEPSSCRCLLTSRHIRGWQYTLLLMGWQCPPAVFASATCDPGAMSHVLKLRVCGMRSAGPVLLRQPFTVSSP